MYSYLVYYKRLDKEKIDKTIRLWRSGSKINIITDNINIKEQILKEVRRKFFYLNMYKGFNGENIFNFNVYIYEGDRVFDEFEICDGKIIGNKLLKHVSKYSLFNLEQYILEHKSLNKDIVVKASAGTGKTYSIVSRINYLIYKHNYKASELMKKISIITFTNEAANNIKIRLKEYYQNYYLLTKNIEILELIGGIENINVSTIHSLAKEAINLSCHGIGLGKNSRIFSGKYEVDLIIKKHLEDYRKKHYINRDMVNLIKYRNFKLEKVIRDLLSKIESKNIRIKEDYILDGGDLRCNIIKEILSDVQEDVIKQALDNNKIRLSSLTILLKDLLKLERENIKKKYSLEYLFIDEFQDTDDKQIEIIKTLKEIIGFNLFIVGDIKQCIYRFRGADDSAFSKINLKCEEINLINNYRTDKKLLNNLNKIFKKLGKNLNNEIEANAILELEDINLEFLKDYKNKDESKLFKINHLNEEFEEKFLKLIKNIEKEDLGTVAILVRTNKEISRIKKIAIKNNLKIDSDCGNNLYETKAARDLCKFLYALKYYDNPTYLFALFETNYINQEVDKRVLFRIRGNKEEQIKYFKKINPIKGFYIYIERLKTESFIKVLGDILAYLKPWNAEISYKRNIEQIIEKLINNSSSEYLTLNEVIKALEINILTNMEEEIREVSNEKIVCTTVHKAKGLEYDMVLMPFCNKSTYLNYDTNNAEIIVDDKNKKIYYSFKGDIEERRIESEGYDKCKRINYEDKFREEIRILYVALTRAKRCVIYFNNEDNHGDWSSIQNLIQYGIGK